MSSSSGSTTLGMSFTADLAVDGNMDGNIFHLSTFESGVPQSGERWKVNFGDGADVKVTKVMVFNRDTAENRLDGFLVNFHSSDGTLVTPFNAASGVTQLDKQLYTFDNLDVSGSIMEIINVQETVFALAEVMIFGEQVSCSCTDL